MAKRRQTKPPCGGKSEFTERADYVRERLHLPGEGTNTVLRHRGATTLDRWSRAGSITNAQFNAANLFRSRREQYGDAARLIASYSPTASIRSTGDGPDQTTSYLKAKAWLDMIDREVFARLPRHYRGTFEAIVILDQAADEAGDMSLCAKTRRAKVLALFSAVADMIDIVANHRDAA